MNELETRKSELEDKLRQLRQKKSEMDARMARISLEIKDKTALHNQLVNTVAAMRSDYKEKLQKFSVLRKLLKEYRREQKEALEGEYCKQIRNSIAELNSISFEPKLSVFKKFDQAQAVNADLFPILSAKKSEFLRCQKGLLKKQILGEIGGALAEKSKMGDLVFYINFLIRYEAYFAESVFVEFLSRMVGERFEYHFLSDRESNRLDKPEWFLDFLLGKYEEMDGLFAIYRDCSARLGRGKRDIGELVESTQGLVYLKVNEILKSKSPQKRNLVLHFAAQYKEYALDLKRMYGFEASSAEVSHMLSKTQMEYVASELDRIHELRYVQWFSEYKKLCKACMVYIQSFGDLDRHFKLHDLISPILSHTKAFLENLRFINRDEVRAVGFIFSELEELKHFIADEESEMLLASPSREINGFATKSLGRITALNAEILKLIKSLATSDAQSITRRIQHFNYTSTESKRTFIVDLHKMLDEYRHCVYFDIVERAIREKIDAFICDEILLKIRFTPDEYLEFRSFYKALKKNFKEPDWRSDQACKSIDAVFEGRHLGGSLFKSVSSLYTR